MGTKRASETGEKGTKTWEMYVWLEMVRIQKT